MSSEKSVEAKRDEADRARRLARTLFADADRHRLLHYAKELDEEAQALEQLARLQEEHIPTTAGPDAFHQKQQEQQQQGNAEAAADEGPRPKAG